MPEALSEMLKSWSCLPSLRCSLIIFVSLLVLLRVRHELNKQKRLTIHVSLFSIKQVLTRQLSGCRGGGVFKKEHV